MLIVSMSRQRIDPAVHVHHVGSSKTRTTWQIAFASRMLARNLLPSPAPSDAPLTMPAMSTNETAAGTIFAEREHLGQLVQPRVGHRHDADVGLDRGERIVRGEHVVAGQRVEQGGLADVGQADDADGQTHGSQSTCRLHRADVGHVTSDFRQSGPPSDGTDRAMPARLTAAALVRRGATSTLLPRGRLAATPASTAGSSSAVRTTGIYCRPCARRAHRSAQNVTFYPTRPPRSAAGFAPAGAAGPTPRPARRSGTFAPTSSAGRCD